MRSPDYKELVIRGILTIATAGMGYLAIDQGVRSVNAEASAQGLTPTPTSRPFTPTITSTVRLNLAATQIRNLERTVTAERAKITATAVQMEIEAAERKRLQELQEEINALRGTRTKTPVPLPTLTPIPSRTPGPQDVISMEREAFNKFVDKAVEVALTAEAKKNITPTPVRYDPPINPTEDPRERRPESKAQEGGAPWVGIALGLTALALVGTGAVLIRSRLQRARRGRP